MTPKTLKTLARTMVFNNKSGLHARCAAKIVELVQSHDCQITFTKNGRKAEGDSILALLTLNCPAGAEVEVAGQGPEAAACLDELGSLFARNFDEE